MSTLKLNARILSQLDLIALRDGRLRLATLTRLGKVTLQILNGQKGNDDSIGVHLGA